MTQEIEPGDLIRYPTGGIAVCIMHGLTASTIIAKGPGWTQHDGSSVNPVPGATVSLVLRGFIRPSEPLEADGRQWDMVAFYRVICPSQEELSKGRVISRFEWETPAPSQPPAPQPGKGWIVNCVSLKIVDEFPDYWLIEFGDGTTDEISKKALAGLPWQPPPPPPWEPKVGGDADWKGDLVIVRGIFEGRAWVEDFDGDLVTVSLSDLSPPKGGA